MSTFNESVITFELAKKIAENSAIERIKYKNLPVPTPVLQDQYLEGGIFWVFFMNKETTDPEGWWIKMAIAVGRYGQVRLVGDFSEEPETYPWHLKMLLKVFEAISSQDK
jgi:hypothetical protein